MMSVPPLSLPVLHPHPQDDPEGAAARQLGLSDLSTAADTLYLFQLPSILPLGVTPDSSRNKQAAAAAAAGSSHQPPQPLRAAAPRELPSGSSGKLLVFKSGRVKLQVGGGAEGWVCGTAGLQACTGCKHCPQAISA